MEKYQSLIQINEKTEGKKKERERERARAKDGKPEETTFKRE